MSRRSVRITGDGLLGGATGEAPPPRARRSSVLSSDGTSGSESEDSFSDDGDESDGMLDISAMASNDVVRLVDAKGQELTFRFADHSLCCFHCGHLKFESLTILHRSSHHLRMFGTRPENRHSSWSVRLSDEQLARADALIKLFHAAQRASKRRSDRLKEQEDKLKVEQRTRVLIQRRESNRSQNSNGASQPAKSASSAAAGQPMRSARSSASAASFRLSLASDGSASPELPRSLVVRLGETTLRLCGARDCLRSLSRQPPPASQPGKRRRRQASEVSSQTSPRRTLLKDVTLRFADDCSRQQEAAPDPMSPRSLGSSCANDVQAKSSNALKANESMLLVESLRRRVAGLEHQNNQLREKLAQTTAQHRAALASTRVEAASVGELEEILKEHKIPVDEFGKGNAKTVGHLFREVEQRDCYMQVLDGRLERVVEPVVIRIYGPGPSILVSTKQLFLDGRVRERRQLPAEKKRATESWEVAACRGILSDLGVGVASGDRGGAGEGDGQGERSALAFDAAAYEFLEEASTSANFPGIVCRYRVHYVTARVNTDIYSPDLDILGLSEESGRFRNAVPFKTKPSSGSYSEKEWVWMHVRVAARERIRGLPDTELRRHEMRQARQPPTQTATIVVTDVEGSTELWEAEPDAMCAAIQSHDDLVRRLLHTWYGYEITTEGDAFCLAFYEPGDALNWATELQQQLLLVDWPEEILAYTEKQGFPAFDENGRRLFRGPRIRVGVATGDVVMFHDNATQRIMYTGCACDRAKEIGELPCGGQIVIDVATYNADGALVPHAGDQAEGEASPASPRCKQEHLIIDEGIVNIMGVPSPVFQVVPRALSARVVHFDKLGAVAAPMSSYWDAPGASLSGRLHGVSRGLWRSDQDDQGEVSVVMVFVCAAKYKGLEAEVGIHDGKVALHTFGVCVRDVLAANAGYVCQEDNGCFMIAFSSGAKAVEACLELQIRLLEACWPRSVVRATEVQDGSTGTVVWRGLRAKCGIFQGAPTRIEPHRTTGRADYFGPLVNRAARFMGAACGGQVFAEAGFIEQWHSPDQKWSWEKIGKCGFKGVSEAFVVSNLLGAHPVFRLRTYPPTTDSKKSWMLEEGEPRKESDNSPRRLRLSMSPRRTDASPSSRIGDG